MLFISIMKKKKTVTVPLLNLRIENDGMHLLIKAKINNKIATLVVDTGASRTVLDKNRIHRFVNHKNFEKQDAISAGLGTANMESHAAVIEKIEMGLKNKKLKIENLQLIILDLSHVNNSYAQIGMKEIDGVLGGDILKNYKAVIDYGKKRIVFSF